MTNSKKILIIGACIAVSSITHATYQKFDYNYCQNLNNFNTALLNPFIKRAQEALVSTANEVQSWDRLWPNETYAETLYTHQKHALRIIKKELKRAAKEAIKKDRTLGNNAQLLYKGFKHYVYKYWKKTQTLPFIQ